MKWALKIRGDINRLEALAATSASLSKNSLAPDVFLLTSARGNIAEDGEFAELFHGDTRRFCGRLYKKKSVHTPGGESFEYEFRGPWQNLKEIQYAQKWGEMNSETKKIEILDKSKVVLGYGDNGEKIDIVTQAKNILQWPKNDELGFEAIFDFETFDIPADELTDLNCEEALMRCLRWAPDLVGKFDYSSTGNPVLTISRRKNLQNITLDKNMRFKGISHCKREDLCIESVCVIYEKTNCFDGESWTVSEKETYPADTQTFGKKSIVHTIKLGGISGTIQRIDVKTQPINEGKVEWWKDKMPFLNDSKISKIELKNTHRETTLPRELVSGSVHEWMLKSAEHDTISAEITCYSNNQKLYTKSIAYKCVATNASTLTYARDIIRGQEEPVPWGLAKAIYDSASQSLVEGECKIADADSLELIGKSVSIPEKFENGIVVSTCIDIFSKTLTLKYGPPKHLYVSDINRLFRLARTRTAPSNTNRGSGLSAASNVVDMGGTESVQNLFSENKDLASLELADSETKKSKIQISIYDIENNDDNRMLEVKLRKSLVVKNGVPHYAYIMMSEPFEMES